MTSLNDLTIPGPASEPVDLRSTSFTATAPYAPAIELSLISPEQGQSREQSRERARQLADEELENSITPQNLELLRACNRADPDSVKGWLNLGADPNARSLAGASDLTRRELACSALAIAATPRDGEAGDSAECVAILLAAGADPRPIPGLADPLSTALNELIMGRYSSPPGHTKRDGDAAALAIIEALARRSDLDPGTPLASVVFAKAFEAGSPCAMRAAVDLGFDINQRDGEGFTALERSIHSKRLNLTFDLLSLGANPNLPNAQGARPAMIAAQKADTEALDLLADHGADFNARCAQGGLAADYARAAGKLKLGRKLDNAAARCNPQTSSLFGVERLPFYASPASMAWTTLSGEDSLRRAPILPTNARDPDALLLQACFEGDAELTRSLLKQGASPFATDALNGHPLLFAIISGSAECVDALVEAGAPLSGPRSFYDELYQTPALNDWLFIAEPLSLALRLDNLPLAKRLLALRPELVQPSDGHRSHPIGSVKSIEAFETLLSAGSPPAAALKHAMRALAGNPKDELQLEILNRSLALCLKSSPLSSLDLRMDDIADLAKAGFEPLAFEMLEKLYQENVDFTAPASKYDSPLYEQALRQGWESGGRWMQEVRASRSSRDELESFLAPTAPRPQRRGL